MSSSCIVFGVIMKRENIRKYVGRERDLEKREKVKSRLFYR